MLKEKNILILLSVQSESLPPHQLGVDNFSIGEVLPHDPTDSEGQHRLPKSVQNTKID